MYEPGDKVRIIGKEYTKPEFNWNHEMDRTIGLIGEVKERWTDTPGWRVHFPEHTTIDSAWVYHQDDIEHAEGRDTFGTYIDEISTPKE